MCPVEGQNWSMEGNTQYTPCLHNVSVCHLFISGLWVCLACVILIAGCDTVSGLTITNIPSSSPQPAAQARSVTSQRPEVGRTTAGKYLFGRSSNVIPTPYAFTTPMNEIHVILWLDFPLTCIRDALKKCNIFYNFFWRSPLLYFKLKSKFYWSLCLFPE